MSVLSNPEPNSRRFKNKVSMQVLSPLRDALNTKLEVLKEKSGNDKAILLLSNDLKIIEGLIDIVRGLKEEQIRQIDQEEKEINR